LFSRLPFDRTRAPDGVRIRDDAPTVVCTQALDWPGALMEAGRNDVTQVNGLSLPQHYVSLNVDERPYTFEVAEPHGVRKVTLVPGAAWVLPAGDPITLRLDAPFSYVRVMLEPTHFDGLLARARGSERPTELRRMYGLDAPPLVHTLQALVAEADLGNPGGLAFVETLTSAVGQQLALHAGVEPPRPARSRGGLSPVARRRTLELIDAKLDAKLSIDTLAREAGLSSAHFARAFKETTGHAPHRYLLALRLQRARRLLERPDAVLSDVALRSGFADQPHFTRLFKREFGVTPGAVLRARHSAAAARERDRAELAEEPDADDRPRRIACPGEA
jgi:AraC family transcriptional regulator